MDLSEILRSCDLFADLNDVTLEALKSEVRIVEIEGQRTLFEQGDRADGLYNVLGGRLRVLVREDSAERVIGEVGPGGYVGEMALLIDTPRTATVRAVRDSVLLHLSNAGFHQLVNHHPSTAVELARTLTRRAFQPHRGSVTNSIRTVAVAPIGPEVRGDHFVTHLVEAFAQQGKAAAVRLAGLPPLVQDAATRTAGDNGRLAEYFSQIEKRHDMVVYVGEWDKPHWTQRCLRQADAILLLASVDDTPQSPPEGVQRLGIPTDLVLLRAAGASPRGTAAWLDLGQYRQHHHVRRDNAADTGRVARLLRGRATGLALSGGGNRTTAYVGVFKALAECGIQPDIIAGTSGGAMLGAMYALGWDPEAMLEKIRALAKAPFYRDLGPPIISLLGSNVMSRLLQGYFGAGGVEDTPIALMPVCASLPHSRLVVASRGPLWRAVLASCAAPGIFPPVPWNGDLLVDGGIVNNLPTDLLFPGCRQGRMLAADVGASPNFAQGADVLEGTNGWTALWRRLTGAQQPPSLLDILQQSACLASNAHLQRTLPDVHLYIQPLARGVTAAKDPLVAMMEAGYRETMAALERFQPDFRAATMM